ncbi:hypothetical protein ACEQ8H_002174 [Pleosporales sp. CAS-2024a]
MDVTAALTATLTAAEIEALGNFDSRTISDAAHSFHRITTSEPNRSESSFEKSLRIKNTLDYFEARTKQDERTLAVLVNCEHALWLANKDTLLKHNPFLSHWVEAVSRLQQQATQAQPTHASPDDVSASNISTVRAMWIKMLLQGEDLAQAVVQTPQGLSKFLLREGLRTPFDLKPYVSMLEDEGIYERTLEPVAIVASATTRPQISDRSSGSSRKPLDVTISAEDAIQKRKGDLIRRLGMDPDTAIFEITRLPISLTYLDFLTTMLSEHTLEKHSIDPPPVITQYIQHALRTIERMGRPPLPSLDGSEMRVEGEVLEYGKEAQSRHILLLLLFIKSLVRKGLMELETLFYEIAEITVRYVWIKEVRDFRSWAEEGVEQGGS